MSSCTLNKLFIFAAGAVFGSLVSWKLLKTKYEQMAQEEIDSVKEAFGMMKEEEYKEEMQTYEDTVQELGYSSNEEEEDEDMKPHVISPDEFDELDDYEIESLTYYADGILADDNGDTIDDVDKLIGNEALDSFGKYDADPDTVFVRNDRLKIDFEIVRDLVNYSDVWQED